MDPLSIAFIALLVVLGGVIAYFADQLGRHLGKKRHTLMGLRPRHTAALITTLSGMLIPLITVLLVGVISSDARRVMLEGRLLIKQRDQVQAELDKRSNELKSKAAEVVDLEGRRAEAARQLSQTSGELAKAQNELRELKSQAEVLRNQAGALRTKLAAVNRQLDQRNAELTKLQGQLADAGKDLAKARRDYSRIKDELDANMKRALDLDNERRQKEEQVTALNTQLKQADEQFKRTVDQFSNEIKVAQADLAKAESDLEKAKLAQDEVRGEVERLRVLSRTIGATLDRNVMTTRVRAMVFRVGDEIARTTVDGGSSASQIRSSILSAIRTATLEAERRGATADGDVPSVGLREIRVEGQTISPEDQIAEAIRVAERSRDAVIIVTALYNSFEGEPLPIRLGVFANPLVFRSGQIVAEIAVDARRPDAEVLRQISQFITSNVRVAAQKGGLIPVAGAEAPYGSISGEEVIELLRQIKSSDRVLRLVAVAGRDIRAADSLRLEFRLR